MHKNLKCYKSHGNGTSYFREIKEQAEYAIYLKELLINCYMVLDHGTETDRLELLQKLGETLHPPQRNSN